MSYILLGLSLGLSAGLAPGPLLALVIQRTLRYGVASGLRIAIAPLITDFPIVILALLIISRLPEIYLNAMMALGGAFVLWLAFEAWRDAADITPENAGTASIQQDLLRGAMINFLNPHPYLFWGAVGAPLVVRAWNQNPWHAIGFITTFYALLVGSKVVLALILGRVRHLPPHRYHRLMQFTSLLLLAAGGFMLYAAWQGFMTGS